MHTLSPDIEALAYDYATQAPQLPDSVPSQREAEFLRRADSYLHSIAASRLGRRPNEDQMQDVRIACLQALRSYDPLSYEATFMTWCYYHVRKALYRGRVYAVMSLPERLTLLAQRLDQAIEEWFQAHEQRPEDDWLCDRAGCTEHDLLLLRRALTIQANTEHTERALDETGETTEHLHLRIDIAHALDLLAAEDPVQAEILSRSALQGQTIDEIARDLHISNKRISALLHDAKLRMRDLLRDYADTDDS